MATDWAWIKEVGGDAFTPNAWFLVLTGKKRVGQQGQLMWAGVSGDSRAWASSPNRERVSRVGLKFGDDRSAVEFIDTKHVLPLPRKLSDADLAHVEMAREFALRKEFVLAKAELAHLSEASKAAARLIKFELERANKGKKKTKAELDGDIEKFLNAEIY